MTEVPKVGVRLAGRTPSRILLLITYEGFQLYGYSSLLKQSEIGTTPPSAEKKKKELYLDWKQKKKNPFK